ncbi:MAG: hypothetical protein J6T51_08270 [Kiritimatiellae bacterium]|nr:hypothetical protein [Kiritimatiellia bacterium]
MKTTRPPSALLFAAVAAVAGCTTPQFAPGPQVPRNATLKTCGGPLVQAHRGSMGEYQDNGAGGYAWCLSKGIRGFETDVRFSRDHELVVMHDSRVERTTDGKGAVEEMTLAELRECRLRNCSEPVPTLGEVVAPLKGRDDVFIELEMKAYPGAFYTPAVLEEYCRKLNAAAEDALRPGTYAFTCFNVTTLETMRRVAPKAPLGYITGGALTEAHIATAKRLGCGSVAPALRDTSKKMVAKAHEAGLAVCLWMVQSATDWWEARDKGADRVTSDYPHLLDLALRRKRKRVVAMDLDATLSQHKTQVPWRNLKALEELCRKYSCVMVGGGNAPQIYSQMCEFPIDIVGNYGMQVATATNGQLKVLACSSNAVDRAFFRRETDRLREKYGYAKYRGEPLEFHPSGMVTFALLGVDAQKDAKLAFDPDKKKRRAMYRDVCEAFPGHTVLIAGSTSFDILGRENNKYDAAVRWAAERGFAPSDIVFIGDDFADGGGDSHVRLGGLDRIVINDYRKFADAVGVLLK